MTTVVRPSAAPRYCAKDVHGDCKVACRHAPLTLTDVNDDAEAALRSEQAFVHAGWETVDLLGTLGRASSKKVLAYRWEAEQERGTSWFRPINRPTEFGAKAFAAYESPSTQTRFRRTLDFLQDGDRVLEVGTGRGYVGGLMLRDGGASAYLGME